MLHTLMLMLCDEVKGMYSMCSINILKHDNDISNQFMNCNMICNSIVYLSHTLHTKKIKQKHMYGSLQKVIIASILKVSAHVTTQKQIKGIVYFKLFRKKTFKWFVMIISCLYLGMILILKTKSILYWFHVWPFSCLYIMSSNNWQCYRVDWSYFIEFNLP